MTLLTKLRSSISSFKPASGARAFFRTKTAFVLIRLLKTVAIVLLFLLLESQVASLLDPGRYKSNFHPRLRWEEFYRMDRNIDLAFIGSSHAYRSFDPALFDKALNVTSFNLGHSDQNPVDSYFVLKELLRYHRPKLVVLELFFPLSEGEEPNRLKASSFLSASYVYDYIKPSLNKMDTLLFDFQPKDYLKAMFRTIRDKDNYKNAKLVKQNYERRLKEIKDFVAGRQPTYEQPTKTSTGELYKGRGYVVNDGVATQKRLTVDNRLKVYEDIEPDWSDRKLEYIQKFITLAKQKSIPVMLVTSPLPPSTVKWLTKYDAIHRKYQEIADRNAVPYADYILINRERNLLTDKHFKDEDHLNSAGVQIFNQDIIQYMKPLLTVS